MVYFLIRVNPGLLSSNVISWLPFARVLLEFKTKLSEWLGNDSEINPLWATKV